MKRSVYEQAAKIGGMTGAFTWKPNAFLEDDSHLFEGRGNIEEDPVDYLSIPHFVVLVAEKGQS